MIGVNFNISIRIPKLANRFKILISKTRRLGKNYFADVGFLRTDKLFEIEIGASKDFHAGFYMSIGALGYAVDLGVYKTSLLNK